MGELFKLKNGTVLVSTEAPGGIYNAAQLKKIAELCSKELAIVKATEDQRLALFVKESEVAQVVQQLKAIGLGFRNYQDGLHQPVSCLGELCETHEQPALSTATELTKLLGTIQLQSSLKIGINGCARCCTPCQTLDVAVIGEAGGYRISLGGKTSQVPELATFFAEGVPPKELPRLIKKIVDLFQSKAEAGESLQDVLERCGVEDFVAALSPYSQDAAGRDDPFGMGDDPASPADDEPAMASDDEAVALDDEAVALDDETSVASEDEVMMESGDDENFAPMDETLGDVSMDDSSADESPAELTLEDAAMDDVGELTIDENSEELPMEEIDEGLISADEDLVLEDDLISMADESEDGQLDEIPVLGEQSEALSEDLSLEEMEEKLDDDLAMESEAPEEIPEEIGEGELDFSEDTLALEESVEETAVEEDFESDDSLVLDDAEMVEEVSEEEISDDVFADASIEDENPELDAEVVSSGAEASEDLVIEEEESEGSSLMSDEEESRFEENLQASIEEEKKLQEVLPVDTNHKAREAALSVLENAGAPELPAPAAPTPQAPAPKIVPTPKRAESPKAGRAMELAGFDLEGQNLHVDFQSGAYVDIDLSTLAEGESRPFRFGKKSLLVTHEKDGYLVEIDGVRMFYPRESTAA